MVLLSKNRSMDKDLTFLTFVHSKKSFRPTIDGNFDGANPRSGAQ